jgi:hypothetical protein
MATGTIAIGQTVAWSGDPSDSWAFTVGSGKTLLLIPGGNVLAGIWMTNPDGSIIKPGLVRACGPRAWGRHSFNAGGSAVVIVTGPGGGGGSGPPITSPYGLTLREWTTADNLQMNKLWNFHPSTC